LEWIALVFVVVTLVFVLWVLYVEPYAYRLREEEITFPFAGPENLTILHITDLHYIPKRRRLLAFLRSLESVDADLVLHTGDFIDEPMDLDMLCGVLSNIKGRYGTFAVVGNHDRYRYRVIDPLVHPFHEHYKPERFRDIDVVRSALEGIGIRCLFNSSETVDCGGVRLYVVGIDDPFMGYEDVEKAFSGVSNDAVAVVLVHSPQVYEETVRRQAALVLSGHTHGGQIRLPFLGALVTRCPLPRSMARGLTRVGDTTLFVSPGLGTSPNLPLRLFCPPEVTLFHIRFASTGTKQ